MSERGRLMQLPAFLQDDTLGYIHLTGSRIGLNNVVYLYNEGYSPEQIHEEFDTLTLDQINQVISYYHENRAAVDAYIAEGEAEIERQRANAPKIIDWEELRRRFEAMNQANNT